MCKQGRQYIRIIHENTTKSREIAEELSRGIEEEGALYLIEEEDIEDVQIELNNNIDINNDEYDDGNKVGISVGIRDAEICVYYQQAEDIPLIIYDIRKEEENIDDFELKTIGKNVAQLIALKPFINLLTTE